MRYEEFNTWSRIVAFGKHAFLSRIFEILDPGKYTKGIPIAVSLVEDSCFLYFNYTFKNLMGDKIEDLLDKGWHFWRKNICSKESIQVKNSLHNFFSVPFDRKTLTLRYHTYDGAENLICLRHEIVLHKFDEFTMAINYFYDVSEKERIEKCLPLKIVNNYSEELNGLSAISPREKEVLKLVAEGHSSKQIADLLFISNHTAISHRKHLIEKFQVKNTAQLIKRASKYMEL